MRLYNSSQVFIATEDHDESIKNLNKLRNNFIHFIPKAWCIEVSGLPLLIKNSLEVIEFLVFESNNIYIDGSQIKSIRCDITRCKESMCELDQRNDV